MIENRTMDERYSALFRSAHNARHVDTMALNLINGILLQPIEDPDMLAAVKRINQARKSELQRRQG